MDHELIGDTMAACAEAAQLASELMDFEPGEHGDELEDAWTRAAGILSRMVIVAEREKSWREQSAAQALYWRTLAENAPKKVWSVEANYGNPCEYITLGVFASKESAEAFARQEPEGNEESRHVESHLVTP